ncbi:MAG: hypothetical protein PHI86_01705 [Candidatus Omnitrophica bacterium]|nr:hypothetical protein [Candidatus Omnitrophota bacterium]HOX54843.1 hypothetical protein [Candidatus Omnitrophota bacterium]
MSLKQIFEKFNSIEFAEKRCVDDEYVEVVVLNKQSEEWNKISQELFGPALKPAGAKPNKDVLSLAEEFGGIRNDQSLFKKEIDGRHVMAMFWPWQDGAHTTLKIFVLPA